MLLPISPGGIPGVLEVTVLQGDIPPLLSVGFLDFLQASIDLKENIIRFKKLDLTLPMKKLWHRTISLVDWSGGLFPIPAELMQKYDLKEGAFNIAPVSSCAYTKGALVEQLNMINHSQSMDVQNSIYEPNIFQHSPHEVSMNVMSSSCEKINLAVNSSNSHEHFQPAADESGMQFDDAEKAGQGFSRSTFTRTSLHEHHGADQSSCSTCACTSLHEHHDADPQCLQQQVRSSSSMGSTLGVRQFDCDPVGHGRALSTERTDWCLRASNEACSAMGPDAAPHHDCVGGEPHELRPSGTSRAGNQSITSGSDEAAVPCGPCSCQVSAPGSATHSPVQSICLLDGVCNLLSSDQLSIQACDGKGARQRSTGQCSNTRITCSSLWPDDSRAQLGDCHKSPSADQSAVRLSRDGDSSTSSALLQPAELSVRAIDGSGTAVTAGAGTWSGADAHIDAASIPVGHDGRRSLVRCGHAEPQREHAEPQRERPRPLRKWPHWMLASGALASSVLLTWDQCSEPFQQKLLDLGHSGDCYVFQYDLDSEIGASISHACGSSTPRGMSR